MDKVRFYSAKDFKNVMKSLGFISRSYNETLGLNENDFAIISIGNTTEYPELSENDLWANGKNNHWFPNAENVLNINFADVDNSGNLKYDDALTDKQSEVIVDFIEYNINKKIFYIHCSAGISRSGAVARYIIDTYNIKDYNKFPDTPNFYVLSMLKRKYREKYGNYF